MRGKITFMIFMLGCLNARWRRLRRLNEADPVNSVSVEDN